MFPFAIIPPFVVSKEEVIKQIACCSDNTILLTSKGSVYVTGINRVGELGVGDTNNRYNTWVLVMQGVNHVAATKESVFSFRTDGKVFSPSSTTLQWEDITATQFKDVGDISGDNIRMVISDNENIVIWKKDKTTWYKGNNSAGQAGTGKTGPIVQSVKMQEDVERISVGGSTIVVQKGDGFLYGSGSDPRKVISSGSSAILTFTKMFGSHTDGGSIVDFSVSTGGQSIIARYSDGKYRTKGLNIGQLPTGQASPNNTLTDVPDGHTPGDGTEPLIKNVAAITTGGTYPNYSYPIYYYTGGELYGAGRVVGGLAGVNVSSGTIPWTIFDASSAKLPNLKGMSFGIGWAIAYSDEEIIVWGTTSGSATIPIVGYTPVSASRPSYLATHATSPIHV